MHRFNKIFFSLAVCLSTAFQVVYLIADNPPYLFPDSGIHITSQIPVFNHVGQCKSAEFPSITGIYVETIPVDFKTNDTRVSHFFQNLPTSLDFWHAGHQYLGHASEIIPGLETTNIGYPFHTFW